MPNLLFIDFETTGLDPIRHSIHRMAGQVVVDGKLACVFDYKMKPDPLKNIDKQSLYAKIIKRKESLAQIYQMVYYIEKIAKKRNNNAKEI